MSVHVTVRLMSEQLERLDMVAENRGLSRSDALRRLIDEATLTREERWQLPDAQELLMLLAERARAGNVAAIRALLDRQDRDEEIDPADDPFADLDDPDWTPNHNEGRRR